MASSSSSSSAAVGGGVGGGGTMVLDLSPYKIAICHLIQVFSPPSQSAVPIPFRSVSHHNRLGLFLFSVTRSCEYFVELSLDELINQLKSMSGPAGDWFGDWLGQHLTERLQGFAAADDLFTFFDKLRAVLLPMSGIDYGDDRTILDPNSHLGYFLRCCILAFNVLSFEGICHLLTNIGTYCNSADPSYEIPEDEYAHESELTGFLDDANLGFDNDPHNEYSTETEAVTASGGSLPFHIQMPKSLHDVVEDIDASVGPKIGNDDNKVVEFSSFTSETLRVRDDDDQREPYLRSKWQVLGYMNEQADLLEKHSNLCSSTSFDSTLKQLQKMAPELHCVKYLQYLNSLYHNDYAAALDNLHCYFDRCGGMEGSISGSQVSFMSDAQEGRYQSALLCLGIMHCHFGQSKPALEALTDAVRIAQVKNDDSCLAYTLAAICELLSETGIPNITDIIASPYNLVTGMGLSMPLSTQQQLLVLLRSSIKRAETMKLPCLVAFNRLVLAKFDLKVDWVHVNNKVVRHAYLAWFICDWVTRAHCCFISSSSIRHPRSLSIVKVVNSTNIIYKKNVRGPLASFGPKAQTMLRTSPINVCKELRLSSFLLNGFGLDGISISNDNSGTFSTSWLKTMPVSRNLLLSSHAHNSNHYDAFNWGSQPNPIPGSILQLAGASYLLKATSWELYGSSPLAQINTLIHLTCFADAASSTELSLAYAKLIQYLMVAKGHKAAFNALKFAEGKLLSFPMSHVHLLKLQLLHERALHKGNLKFARKLCDDLGMLASSLAGVDMELKTEASLRHTRTLLAANRFSEAAAVAHSLFRTCYEYNLHIERAVVLLLLANIHKKSGNPVLGLPYALASLSFCQSLNLDLLEASASLTIAELWLSLGSSHSKRALSLVYRSLPLILGHGGLELQARAYITVAKCHLSDPSFSVSKDPDVLLDSLRQAAEDLEILEYHEMAAEAYYLMSMVYNMLEQFRKRDQAATSFKKHVMALEHPLDEEL